jgi:predicted nucleic acid-binding protein
VRYVADASVVVAYLLGLATAGERDAILGDVHAPSLVDVETTQALRGLLRGSRIDIARAQAGLVELEQLGVHRHPDAALLGRAWELRDVCTIYDGLYVGLALALDATLVTRDVPLARGVAGRIAILTP